MGSRSSIVDYWTSNNSTSTIQVKPMNIRELKQRLDELDLDEDGEVLTQYGGDFVALDIDYLTTDGSCLVFIMDPDS